MTPQAECGEGHWAVALAVYGLMCVAAFLTLDRHFDGLWVFYSQGRLAVAWVVAGLGLAGIAALGRWLPPLPPQRAVPVLALAATMAALVVASVVLDRFINSADEYAYLFEARTWEAGRLWNPAPPLGQGLAADYTWVKDGKWVGQYPPGWPLVLAIAERVGLPAWAVDALLGGLSICLLWRLAWRHHAGFAALAVLAYAASPFFLFNAGSMHSHMTAAVTALVAYSLAEAALERRSAALAAATGGALGYLAMIRYSTAPLMALPLLGAVLARGQGARFKLLISAALGALPLIAALLAYHWAITGDPFKPVYYLGNRTLDHLYFDSVGMRKGISISFWRVIELVEWTAPSLVLLYLAALAAKARCGMVSAADAVFPLFVLLFLFYPFDGANRYGPRYWFDAFPFLVLTIASAWPAFVRLHVDRLARRLGALAVVASLIALPFLAQRYHTIVRERQEVTDLVAAAKLDNAVVLVQTDPGDLWTMEGDDLARNGIDADGPVLYARGDLVSAAQIRVKMPNRRLYIYRREDWEDQGSLREIR